MHETVVAQSIVGTIVAEAEKIGKRPIAARVSCGQFNMLNDEIMRFAFEVAAGETVCRGTTLQIVHKPLRANCKSCGTAFDFDIYSSCCPDCGSEEFTFAPDAPLLLEEIEFED